MATIRVGNGATINKGISKGPTVKNSSSTVRRKPCARCGGRK